MAFAVQHHKVIFKRRFLHNSVIVCNLKTNKVVANATIPICKGGMEFFNTNVDGDSETWASELQACANMRSLREGKLLHARLFTARIKQNVYVETNLMNMYSKCGSLADTRRVFDKSISKNRVMWNTMVAASVRHCEFKEAIRLYYEMQEVGIQPDNFTFPCVLRACASLPALQQGKEIHHYIIKRGFEPDVFVINALIDMYAKCGNFQDARQMFDEMSQRDLVSWNTIISGYTQNSHGEQALELFVRMLTNGVEPDTFTVVSILSACAQLYGFNQGKEVHGFIIRRGLDSHVIVQSTLLTTYADCGNIGFANQIFHNICRRDVVLWNAMISGYARNGYYGEALERFCEMQQEGMEPNSVTIASLVPACAYLAVLQPGKQLHSFVIKSGLESNFVVASALVTMYAKCGSVDDAVHLFDKMPERDVVSWNGMIGGYVENGHYDKGLKFFHEMQLAGVKPDSITIASILPLCGQLVALQKGKEIHDYCLRHGLDSDILVANAFVDMYAKCGSIGDANHVFDKISQKDVVSWTAMIAGCGMHGYGVDALALFYQMQQAGIKPDLITFTAILAACSHAGLLEEGIYCFKLMSEHYRIMPGVEHYGCIVDLLGRAGCLAEAHDLIKEMPLEPNADVWGALLGACRIYPNIDLAEHVAKELFELQPENAANYVLLSNIYAAAGKWDNVGKIRKIMKDKGLKRSPGCSWIEHKNKVHAFISGDSSHPQIEKISEMLESLSGKMEAAGYIPDTNFVLHNVR